MTEAENPPSQSSTQEEDTTTTTSEPAPPPPPPPVLKHTQDLNYMHRPPRIVPNYGKRPRGVLPKSSVSRVLLYDNVTQQQMLHVKMTHLRAEQRKTGRLMDLHRKSFIVRRLHKQKHQADTILHVDHHTLPVLTITNSTGGGAAAGDSSNKARGTRRWARKDDGEKAPQVKEGTDTSLTPRNAGGEGGGEKEGGGGGSLPSIHRKHQGGGASSSQGFTVVGHPLSSVHQARQQRGLHTASTTGQREGGHGNNNNDNVLPDISPRTSGRRAGDKASSLHMESGAGGLTRLVHTFPPSRHPAGSREFPPSRHTAGSREGGRAKGRKGKGKAGKVGGVGERTTEDERYRKLERLLVRIEPPNEGYLELSPSFHLPRKTMTFTRPSSFHSSLFHSSSSSLSRGPILIGSLSSVVWI